MNHKTRHVDTEKEERTHTERERKKWMLKNGNKTDWRESKKVASTHTHTLTHEQNSTQAKFMSMYWYSSNIKVKTREVTQMSHLSK